MSYLKNGILKMSNFEAKLLWKIIAYNIQVPDYFYSINTYGGNNTPQLLFIT